MKLLATMLMSVLMSVSAYAADVDGTWTGSTVSPDGTTIPIKDGKIDGSTITFTVTFDFGGTPFVLPYKGVVSSDQIKMSADAGGAPIEMLLKKSKAVAALDGTWEGTVSGPQGDFPLSFTFKADGAKLTGSTVGFEGTPVPIKDGKIDGSNISYMVSLDFGGMTFDMSYKGVVASDQIKTSGDAFGMPFDFVLKKTK